MFFFFFFFLSVIGGHCCHHVFLGGVHVCMCMYRFGGGGTSTCVYPRTQSFGAMPELSLCGSCAENLLGTGPCICESEHFVLFFGVRGGNWLM